MIIPSLLALFGLILIYIEFFIPGGIMGFIGGLLLVSSIIVVLISDYGAMPLVLFITVSLVALIITIKLALWHVRKSGSIFLDSDQKGYTASFYDKDLIGELGTVESDLKPSGYVSVNGKSYQAVSKGNYINKGVKVQVLGGEGARLIVKEVTKE